MTYEDVTECFGGNDRSPSEILLKLSMSYPDFGVDDLLSVFRLLKDNFRTAGDINRRALDSAKTGSNGNVLNMFSFAHRMTAADVYYSSDVVMRNLWRIMFETREWDAEILFQPVFVERFFNFIAEVKPGKSQSLFGKLYEREKLDFWEKAAEFGDMLKEKIGNTKP